MYSPPTVRLTERASCAGCAAKLAPGLLADLVRPLANSTDPDLLIGLQTSDDAAVYRIAPDRALVQTIDFFPPVVDNPRDFGRIAAANSMSDIFAMGGTVAIALNVVAWPSDLDPELLAAVLDGADELVRNAGGIIAGGHTIVDDEPKYGLSVTGFLDPATMLTKGGAEPGDLLFLTKPLGTGVITTAAKNGATDPEILAAAVRSMTTLNLAASRAALRADAHACTDITGYGLMGHAHEMATRSGLCLQIDTNRLPWLPGARLLAEQGHLPGGYHRNRAYYSGCAVAARIEETVDPVTASLIYNPETSGGLLIAVSPDQAELFEQECGANSAECWRIGVAMPGEGVLAIAGSI